MNLLAILISAKMVRVYYVLGLLVTYFVLAKSEILSLLSGYVMPDQFAAIWNFFQMNINLNIVISAYISIFIWRIINRIIIIVGS